jgi:hypothetical protein
LGVKQGHFTTEVDLLLINQIVALLKVAMLLDQKKLKQPMRKTSKGILRQQAINAARAEKLFDKALGKYSHPIS